jgi:5-(carboxyamino)imidazole ribonucleotide mutase
MADSPTDFRSGGKTPFLGYLTAGGRLLVSRRVESSSRGTSPRVAIIMGSDSDWPVMRAAGEAVGEFDVTWEARVVSAHRTPEDMVAFARGAADRGVEVIVAGAGGAAHLPGMVASLTPLPVVGVPVAITKLYGMDALLSIVQMPAGVPVATVAVDGARNAGLLAVRILAATDPELRAAMGKFQASLADEARAKDDRLQAELGSA